MAFARDNKATYTRIQNNGQIVRYRLDGTVVESFSKKVTQPLSVQPVVDLEGKPHDTSEAQRQADTLTTYARKQKALRANNNERSHLTSKSRPVAVRGSTALEIQAEFAEYDKPAAAKTPIVKQAKMSTTHKNFRTFNYKSHIEINSALPQGFPSDLINIIDDFSNDSNDIHFLNAWRSETLSKEYEDKFAAFEKQLSQDKIYYQFMPDRNDHRPKSYMNSKFYIAFAVANNYPNSLRYRYSHEFYCTEDEFILLIKFALKHHSMDCLAILIKEYIEANRMPNKFEFIDNLLRNNPVVGDFKTTYIPIEGNDKGMAEVIALIFKTEAKQNASTPYSSRYCYINTWIEKCTRWEWINTLNLLLISRPNFDIYPFDFITPVFNNLTDKKSESHYSHIASLSLVLQYQLATSKKIAEQNMKSSAGCFKEPCWNKKIPAYYHFIELLDTFDTAKKFAPKFSADWEKLNSKNSSFIDKVKTLLTNRQEQLTYSWSRRFFALFTTSTDGELEAIAELLKQLEGKQDADFLFILLKFKNTIFHKNTTLNQEFRSWLFWIEAQFRKCTTWTLQPYNSSLSKMEINEPLINAAISANQAFNLAMPGAIQAWKNEPKLKQMSEWKQILTQQTYLKIASSMLKEFEDLFKNFDLEKSKTTWIKFYGTYYLACQEESISNLVKSTDQPGIEYPGFKPEEYRDLVALEKKILNLFPDFEVNSESSMKSLIENMFGYDAFHDKSCWIDARSIRNSTYNFY